MATEPDSESCSTSSAAASESMGASSFCCLFVADMLAACALCVGLSLLLLLLVHGRLQLWLAAGGPVEDAGDLKHIVIIVIM